MMNVLIIDDNKDITNMLSKYLQLSDHECVTSNDGRNGLNMIIDGNYDVVLLDLSMPDFSGIDIIESLKEKKKILDQKIVLFTASSISSSEIDVLVHKGAHSCLKKPIDPDELISYIESLDGQKINSHN